MSRANANTKPQFTSYGKMLQTIAQIAADDWVGANETPVPAPDLRGLYDDASFLRQARGYLRRLGDPNLALVKVGDDPASDWTVGFEVRAAQDCLYVTDAWGDERLCTGDRIVAIDGRPLDAYRAEPDLRAALWGEVPEREDWSYYLQYATELSVEFPAENTRAALRPLHLPPSTPRSQEPACSYSLFGRSNPAGHACYLRLGELEDAGELEQLLAAHRDELVSAERLVLDLRTCAGMPLDAAVALMPYLIDEPVTAAGFIGEQGLWVRYSQGNAGRMVASLEAELAYTCDNDPDEQAFYEQEIARVRELAGAGLVWEDVAMPQEWLEPVVPAGGPARVVVLSDVGCRNESEQLLAMASAQRKVTTLGRASLGNSDYQQLMGVNFDDDVFFAYPAGMTRAAAEGQGVLGRGVQVDVRVPWDPAELERDVVLERALGLGGVA